MAPPTISWRLAAESSGVARLDLELAAPVDLSRVPAVLGGPDAAWLGDRAPDGPSDMRRFGCDLELHVSPESRALFRKAAIVGLGEPHQGDGQWIVPVEWFAATLAPLFPVFVGQLRLRTDRIELHGRYVPPGGLLGFALDRALLNAAARATGRWFLRKVAVVLG